MPSCDNLTLSFMLKNLSYNDILLSNAVGNAFYESSYANEKVCYITGRGFADFRKVLNEMNIEYEIITFSELLKNYPDNFEDIMFLAPKNFLDFPGKINFSVRQLIVAYSAYRVKEITENTITLILDTENQRELLTVACISVLEKMEKMSVLPLGYGFLILRLLNRNQIISKDIIISNLYRNVKKCLEDNNQVENDMNRFSGTIFYDKVLEYILNWESYIEIVKSMFFSSMAAGSNFFFRTEFAEVLRKNKTISVEEKTIARLEESGKLWRELKIYLRRSLISAEKINLLKIKNIFNEIKDKEIISFGSLIHDIEKHG